ncbi:MAG: IMP dehydrogenase [Actinomycetota bacterium]
MAEVQIGRGKSARRAYELDDVTIVPSRRTRNADDVDLSWKIDAYKLGLPLVAAGINAPMTTADAVAAGDAGALAVVNLELLVAEHGTDGLADALTAARGDNRIAVSVSPKNAEELVPHAVRAEAEMIIIRGDVVSADHVSSGGETLDLKSFIRGLDTPVIVGACQSYEAALHLMRTGAAGVLVGHHGDDLGIAVPLATAIADVRAARVRHLDETSVYCHIIATGPIGDGTDVAKAIAIGADAVVVDQALVTGDDPAGEALRETMAVCGYTDVKAFQKAEVVVR